MFKEFISNKLKKRKLSATSMCHQIDLSYNTYNWHLRKNHFEPETLAIIAEFLKIPIDELRAQQSEPIKKRKKRINEQVTTDVPIKVTPDAPVIPIVVKKVRKPRKSKTVDIVNLDVPEVKTVTKVKRGRKPRVSEPISINVTENEIKMVKMELEYLRQMLILKDEMIDLLKRK